MDYRKLITPSLRWKEITAIARIHHIPRYKRTKGGIKVRRNKVEVTKDIRRAMSGTFPDRVTRTKEILDWLMLSQWNQSMSRVLRGETATIFTLPEHLARMSLHDQMDMGCRVTTSSGRYRVPPIRVE